MLFCLLLSTSSCKSVYDSAYYRTMEFFGQEKRDILVNRVDDARDSQEEAKEQFASALDRFRSIMQFDGGDLEEIYDRLSAEKERSDRRAADVKERIDEVEDVATALFEEWQQELQQYGDASLRRASEDQLRQTQNEYGKMIRAMQRAESKMEPVLVAFNDQVLFLKHNLNARAIASLENTAAELQSDVNNLIAEMEASIDEANRFIDSMRG